MISKSKDEFLIMQLKEIIDEHINRSFIKAISVNESYVLPLISKFKKNSFTRNGYSLSKSSLSRKRALKSC